MVSARMQSIPTMYNGTLYRSALEARWAVYFDKLRIEYVYEEDGKILRGDDGEEDICYCPDFRLLNIYAQPDLYVEVKPQDFDRRGTDDEWRKLRRFCRHARIFLAMGKPTGYPMYDIAPTSDDDITVNFTTDHGSTEARGGIQPGQFRIYTCCDDMQFDELKDAAFEASNYRFGKIR